MIERIIDLLKADGGVTDYRINTTKRESYELFFVHKDLETVRSTDTTDIKVTVFVASDGKLGDATFSVYASYTNEKIAAEISAAKKRQALPQMKATSFPQTRWAFGNPIQTLKNIPLPSLLQ